MFNWLRLNKKNAEPKVFDWDAYYKDIADGVSTRVIESKFRKMAYYIEDLPDNGASKECCLS